jgi:hypothetical protein
MNTSKQLGIWMDHSTAHLIELSNDNVATNTIELSPAPPEHIENHGSDESLMNNKEQNQLSDYFLNLSKVIKEYNEVVLFGPSSAKTELYNQLKEDIHFDEIKIDVELGDIMTDHEQEIFVRKYFAA